MNLKIYPDQMTDLSGYAFLQLHSPGEFDNFAPKMATEVTASSAPVRPANVDNRHPVLSPPRTDGHRQLQTELVKTFTVLTDQFKENSVQTNQWLNQLLSKFSTSTAKSERFPSPEEIEIELSRSLAGIKKTQQEMSLGQMKQTRLHNQEKMKQNHEKIQEATEAAKAARKAGVVSKFFNWLSASVMLVVGLGLMMTGIGVGVGALMVASGALSVLNMVLQHAGENGWISKGTMSVLGWILVAVQAVVAVVAIIVTLGAAFPAVVAKVSQSAANALKALTQMTTTMAQSAERTLKLGVHATRTIADVANGSASVTHNALQQRSLHHASEAKTFHAELNNFQKCMDAMQQGFKQNMTAWLHAMSSITQMLHAKGQTSNRILSRPAAV